MDFERSRRVWHDHIARWGGGPNKGFLVRAGAKRPATMAMSEYKPTERGLYADGAVRFMVSAYKVSAANYVNFELDEIQFKGKRYRIIMMPNGSQPDGTWIAFDCPCMFVSVV